MIPSSTIYIIITVFKNHDVDQIQACVTDTDCELVSAERGLDYKCFQYMSVLTFVRIVFKNDHMFILSISSWVFVHLCIQVLPLGRHPGGVTF